MKKRTRPVLPALTMAVTGMAILSVVVFSLANRSNITHTNREYLLDNTRQMAAFAEDSLRHGLTNIQVLSSLVGEILPSPEVDIAALQRILDDSIFDFIEFTDRDGRNHNVTGGVSEAGDRQYYLDAMEGNSGVELIFSSRATNETLLVFYAPVLFQGEIIGSLIGAYQETAQLGRLLTMDVFGHRAEAYLCSEDGLIIASNQEIDTTEEVPIEAVLGPRAVGGAGPSDFIYRGETALVPLLGNETGACVMGLDGSEWYIVQVFPEEAGRMMLSSANRIGISLAVFLVLILSVLLILTYVVLDRSRLETQAALEEAEAASRAKSDFLFNMSHDIRTPMNAITGFLRLLKERQEDPRRRQEYIRHIEDASELLLSIINNVLEMSRIEGGEAALEETVQDVEHLADSVCALVLPQMQEKRIAFAKTVEVRHRLVWCDVTKVREVYLNILNNACKYTPGGGSVTARVTELPAEKEGFALYRTEIADTGAGISEDFLPHLFEPFSRERDTTHSKVAGAGLGLTIAKRLVDLMGGTIQVESAAGKGTTFTVTLPHRIAGDGSLCESEGAEAPNFSGKRVLLAEDGDLNAEIATELLQEMGFEVERAQDGDVCVAMMERAGEDYYDLILMDIQMPGRNGYQAAEAIRGMGGLRKAAIPIVAMSANSLEEDRQNARAAGMNAHLAKPIDIQKLTETLRGILL